MYRATCVRMSSTLWDAPGFTARECTGAVRPGRPCSAFGGEAAERSCTAQPLMDGRTHACAQGKRPSHYGQSDCGAHGLRGGPLLHCSGLATASGSPWSAACRTSRAHIRVRGSEGTAACTCGVCMHCVVHTCMHEAGRAAASRPPPWSACTARTTLRLPAARWRRMGPQNAAAAEPAASGGACCMHAGRRAGGGGSSLLRTTGT